MAKTLNPDDLVPTAPPSAIEYQVSHRPVPRRWHSPLLDQIRALEVGQDTLIDKLPDGAAPCPFSMLIMRISPYLVRERKISGRKYTARTEEGGVRVWRLT